MTLKESSFSDEANPKIVLRNRAKKKPDPDTVGNSRDLAYLLWYYRLAEWKDGSCPRYDQTDKPVLLRCKTKDCTKDTQSATVFWPVIQ